MVDLYPNHKKPWSQEDRRELKQAAEEFVSRASARYGRSPWAVQLQMLLALGVPRTVVEKMAKRREHGRWAKTWDVLNTQIIGGFIAGILAAWAAKLFLG